MKLLGAIAFVILALPLRAASLDDLSAFNLVHNECQFEQGALEECYEQQLAEGLNVDLPKLITHLQVICDEEGKDQAQACYYTGRAMAIYQNEDPVSLTGPAMQNYQRACEGGHELGCTYAYQRQTLVSDTKAVIQGQIKLQETCFEGENRACRMLGAGLSDERWQSIFNLKSMSASYNQECETNGLVYACSILAYDEKPGFERAEATKIQLGYQESSCERGVTENCILLGDRYATGADNVPMDLAAASKAYATGCDDDDPLMPKACALYTLTELKIEDSDTVKEKILPAVTRACLNGYSEICFNFGKNIEPDLAQLEEECDASNADACMAWGVVLYEGKWVERDLPLAFEKVQNACSLEESLACAAFSNYLLEPDVPAQDSAKLAVDYRERACLYGDAASCQLVDAVPEYYRAN